MQYITHHRLRGKAACGLELNVPYATSFSTIGNFIATNDSKAICYTTSEMAHKYFARNDDGQGLRRGALTYAIAYSQRHRTNTEGNRAQRFTDEEIETLERDWSKYLIPDISVILFNHDFFNAEVDDLEKMAKALNIVVKEDK